jgi:ribosomal protein S18 acetylase RimI-like enzyme
MGCCCECLVQVERQLILFFHYGKNLLEKALEIFREHILPEHQIWIAEEENRVVGYMAIKGSYISRLYVDPSHQSHGVGDALLERARNLSPQGLELHTHVENFPARQFYERRGFVAVKFGISPPPELAPDVEYHWRPSKHA